MSSSAPIVDRIRIIPRPDDFLDRNVGASGEVFFNRATSSLRVYNGRERGGFEVARADLANVDTTHFLTESKLGNLSIESFQDVMYMFGPPQDGQVLIWRTDHWMPEDLQITGGGASVDVSATAPANPQVGNLWLDTNSGKLYIYYQDEDSAQWIQPSVVASGSSGASVDVSATAPANPQVGNLWLDINSGKLYIYYQDEDSAQWIQPSVVASGGTAADANTLQNQPGSYYLDYGNFTNTPTSIINFGITDGTVGQVLSTDGDGNFSFVSRNEVDLTDLSVLQQSASGNGTLTYNSSTGVFTYIPPNLSSFLTSYTETDTFASVTGRGATTDTAVTINNTLTVNDLQTGGAGTPEISSVSSIRLTAPDGIVALNPIRLASYTTTQRESLTALNGDMIYNTTTNKFQGYANGVWVDLH